jgi:glyoxylase-like metal-dependent hydrolase (beta-lactamase superfamily II)
MPAGTLHVDDSQAEVHKISVGPMDNNVYIVRCKQTGDAVLLDAANEHERLLELCQQLGVRKVLETHGHWDHIQAVPAVRDAGIDVGITAEDAKMLPSYDFVLEDDTVIEVGRLRLRTVKTPGHTAGSMCFILEGSPVLFTGDTLFPGGPGATQFEGGDFSTIIRSIEGMYSGCQPTPSSSRATASTRPSGTRAPTSREWVDRGW